MRRAGRGAGAGGNERIKLRQGGNLNMTLATYDKLFIDGQWIAPATSATIDVISPHTEEVIGRVPQDEIQYS